MLLSAAECACFSYRRLAHARHLDGLTRLTKLQLDNNSITRIEGLEQLARHTCPSRCDTVQHPAHLHAHHPCAAASNRKSTCSHSTCVICTPTSQTTLTWLDLSFNRITAIEGLGSLTRLVDLSLYSNQLEALRGLEGLTAIAALSLGVWDDNCNYPVHVMNMGGKGGIDGTRADRWEVMGSRMATFTHLPHQCIIHGCHTACPVPDCPTDAVP